MRRVEESSGPRPVLFVSATGELGGAERSLYELLRALPRERLAPALCAPKGPLTELCAAAGVPVYLAPLRRFRRTYRPFRSAAQAAALLRGGRAVAKLVRKHRPAVIHANTDSAALFAWQAARRTGRPFVVHCRDLRPLGLLRRLLSDAAARTIAISAAVEKHLLAEGVPSAKLALIVNGIDTDRFHGPEEREEREEWAGRAERAGRARARAEARARLGLGAGAPVLISVGALVPWKRHELFIEAVAEVRRRRPDVSALLVGDDLFGDNGEYARFIREQAETRRKSGGAGREGPGRAREAGRGGVLLLGRREDVPELLAAADVLVSAGDAEPFGRVLVEAGAAGLPVVSTATGGKPEIVADGETGLLTAAEPRALARAVLRLLDDPALARRLGDRGRERALACFGIRRTAAEVAALLEEIGRNAIRSNER